MGWVYSKDSPRHSEKYTTRLVTLCGLRAATCQQTANLPFEEEKLRLQIAWRPPPDHQIDHLLKLRWLASGRLLYLGGQQKPYSHHNVRPGLAEAESRGRPDSAHLVLRQVSTGCPTTWGCILQQAAKELKFRYYHKEPYSSLYYGNLLHSKADFYCTSFGSSPCEILHEDDLDCPWYSESLP